MRTGRASNMLRTLEVGISFQSNIPPAAPISKPLKKISSFMCVHLRHLRTSSFSLIPWPEHHALTIDGRITPLLRKSPAVFLQQLFGIDAIALKRPAAEMV